MKMNLDITKLTRVAIVSKGSNYVETKVIDLSTVYVPQSVTGTTINKVRKKGLDAEHINKLSESMQNGIDYSKRPPIVVRKPQWVNGVYYEYELLAGAHRFEALRKMNAVEWIFDIYEIGLNGVSSEKATTSLQIRENDHSPEKSNTAEDLINVLSYLIQIKELKNTEEEIKAYLHENTDNLHSATFSKIVRQVVNRNGAYQDIKTYPSDQLEAFLQTNPEGRNYAWGGNLDHDRDEFGWTVLEGYEYEYLINALKRFDETGKPSYFLNHTKAPTKKKSLKARRLSQIREFERLERGMLKSVEFFHKTGTFPWRIEAFLGQDVKNKEKQFLRKEEIRNR